MTEIIKWHRNFNNLYLIPLESLTLIGSSRGWINGYLGSRVKNIWVGLSSVFTYLVGALGHHLSWNRALYYTLYGYLAIYCIICYFVYIVNIESDAVKPVSDYFCCNSCIETTDDWLNFSQSGSNDEQASIMLKIPIIKKLIYGVSQCGWVSGPHWQCV